jgi:hypothetical protein
MGLRCAKYPSLSFHFEGCLSDTIRQNEHHAINEVHNFTAVEHGALPEPCSLPTCGFSINTMLLRSEGSTGVDK